MNGLIDFLEDYLSPIEIIELLGCVLKHKGDSEKILREYAVYHNICPICCSELSLYTYSESRGEHFGTPVEEMLSELRCVNCGWSDEDWI